MRHRPRPIPLAIVAAFLAVAPAAPAEVAADATPHGLVVRDLSVMVIDPNQQNANDEILYGNSLPSFARTSRPTHDEGDPFIDQPIPGGLITLESTLSPAELDRFDVLLEIDDGRLLGGWPSPTQRRHTRLLWRNVELADGQKPPHLPESHWLAPLRTTDRRVLTLNRQAERFILYDFKMAASSNVTLETGDEPHQFRVNSAADQLPPRLTLLKTTPDGYFAGFHTPDAESEPMPVVEADPPATAPADDSDANANPTYTIQAGDTLASIAKRTLGESTSWVEIAELNPTIDPNQIQVGQVISLPQGATLDATPFAEQDQPDDTAAKATAVLTLSSSPVADLAEALGPIVEALTDLGMGQPEIDHALRIVEAQARHQTGLLVLHLVEDPMLQKRLPLEVTPEPAAVHRAALVIVVNADPALADQIDQLITELGSDDWATREQAQNNLHRLGQAAKPRLEAARDKGDPEASYRIHQILELLE